jgi:hypothetical protein
MVVVSKYLSWLLLPQKVILLQLLSIDKKLKSVHLDWRNGKYYGIFAESKNCGGRETAVAK